jgi:hypothetical protein
MSREALELRSVFVRCAIEAKVARPDGFHHDHHHVERASLVQQRRRHRGGQWPLSRRQEIIEVRGRNRYRDLGGC